MQQADQVLHQRVGKLRLLVQEVAKAGQYTLYDFNFIPVLHCIHALLIIKELKSKSRQDNQCNIVGRAP